MATKISTASDKIKTEIIELFDAFSPREVEDILFDVFSTAEIHTDGLLEEAKESRVMVHSALRRILFELNNPEILNQYKDE